MRRIVAVTQNREAQKVLATCFEGFSVRFAEDIETALEQKTTTPCEFVFLDIRTLSQEPSLDYHAYRRALYPLWRTFPTAHVVVMSEPDDARECVRAVRAGASDYLTHPVTVEAVELVRQSMEDTAQAEGELSYLRDQFWGTDDLELVRTRSPAMQVVLNGIQRVAPTDTTVLLTGETGTGKNLLATLIHRHSRRSDRAFVSIHCGAIPETLLESELFGHERGAFTGAVRRKLGKFQVANGGTLLLDEIGTISTALQIKLLQVLQERTIQRVGADQSIPVDVRILAATNADLQQAIRDGSFRTDLYYRLNVFAVEVPRLRERPEDIPTLTDTFVKKFNLLHGKEIDDVHPAVLEAFQRYPWPGNVRELEGLIERAYILESSSTLSPESFPNQLFGSDDRLSPMPLNSGKTLAEARQQVITDFERLYLKQLLEQHQGKINRTASEAGITVRQLHNLMKKHGLEKETFRRKSVS